MPQPVGTGKTTRWREMSATKSGGGPGARPEANSRAAKRTARMAVALRANLLKRKQQKRDRADRAKDPKDA